jgi:hypothetical protein
MRGRGRPRRVYRVYPEDEFLHAADLGVEGTASEEPRGDGWGGELASDDLGGELPRAGWDGELPSDGHGGELPRDGLDQEHSSEIRAEELTRRRPRRAIGARSLGIAVLAAAAMAVSAIVVHALRSDLEGGAARIPGSAASTAMPATSNAPGLPGTDRRRGSRGQRGSLAHPASSILAGGDPPVSRHDSHPQPDRDAGGVRTARPAGRSAAGRSTAGRSAAGRSTAAPGEEPLPASAALAPADGPADGAPVVVADASPANPEFEFER